MAAWMTIELKGLHFFALHGMYEEEVKVGNEFLVDLSAKYNAPEEIITSLNDTINYVDIYQIIGDEFKHRKYLLETMAMNICETLHQRFVQIKSIEISIKKINPPITNFKGTVGVNFTKDY
jgi:dihydroneopterin aldolase